MYLANCVITSYQDLLAQNELLLTILYVGIFIHCTINCLSNGASCRTPDEDFGILLEAAVMYDRRVAAFLNEDDSTGDEILWKEMYDGKQFLYPRLLFIITGKHLLCQDSDLYIRVRFRAT